MILDGKKVAQRTKENLSDTIQSQKLKLRFVILQVGNNEASNVYIRNKVRYANEIGIQADVIKYNSDIKEEKLLNEIEIFNKDENINGIILQLPIPKHLNEYKLLQAIDVKKDIDGLTELNMGKAYFNQKGHYSATANGVLTLLDYYNIDIAGKNIVVAGKSNLVGKILSLLLINKDATVTVCNSQTKNIEKYIKEADIFISAIGRAKYFTSNYFLNNKKLVIIDVGTNFENGKLVGDIDFENVKDIVDKITPVPGGVGALTVSELIKNVVNTHEF